MPFFPPHDVSVIVRDYNRMPYSNDWIPVAVIFGCSPVFVAFPVGPAATTVPPIGTGPGLPGLIYPEIYLPAQQQLRIDVQTGVNAIAGDDLFLNFIGAKVFKGAR